MLCAVLPLDELHIVYRTSPGEYNFNDTACATDFFLIYLPRVPVDHFDVFGHTAADVKGWQVFVGRCRHLDTWAGLRGSEGGWVVDDRWANRNDFGQRWDWNKAWDWWQVLGVEGWDIFLDFLLYSLFNGLWGESTRCLGRQLTAFIVSAISAAVLSTAVVLTAVGVVSAVHAAKVAGASVNTLQETRSDFNDSIKR